MAGSRIPGPTHYDPFSQTAPARTPGPLGRNDAADPTILAQSGDTFGPLGVNDYAGSIANSEPGPIRSSELHEFGDEEQTEFMRKVYEAQLARVLRRKAFFPGLPADELGVVEGGFKMRKDAAKDCKALLARARVDLKQQQQEKDEGALKVERIGIASAYRDPWRDLAAWEKSFKKHYGKTKDQRVKLIGGEHGERSVEFMARKMAPIKAVPGFSNHTSGIAVDFTTTDNKEILGPNTNQRNQWEQSWFYKWLVTHASMYKFKQLPSEEWHWDYTGGYET